MIFHRHLQNPWIGAFREQGNWTWSDGNKMEFFSWMKDNPDDFENCITLNLEYPHRKGMNDRACSVIAHFICKVTNG